MNEEIQTAMDKVLKAIDLWQENKTRALADELELKLSVLKLLVGVEKFDQLPAFARVLREASAYIEADIKATKQFNQFKDDIDQCLQTMADQTQKCYNDVSTSLDKMEQKLEG